MSPKDYIDIGLGLVNTVGVLIIVLYTRSHFMATRASSYIERFNNPSMNESRLCAERMISELQAVTPSDRSSFLAELMETSLPDRQSYRANVILFLNVFAELGAALKMGVVNRRGVAVFESMFTYFYEGLYPFIDARRQRSIQRGHGAVWDSLDYLYCIVVSREITFINFEKIARRAQRERVRRSVRLAAPQDSPQISRTSKRTDSASCPATSNSKH